MDFLIHTARLTLRPVRETDVDALHAICNSRHVLRWMPDWESTSEKLLGMIQFWIAQYPLATREDACLFFAVERAGELIGMVGIWNKEEVENEIEVAYYIDRDHTGHGYGAEAVSAASEWALETLGLDYLIAIVETDNLPSQRVVERCGFQRMETRTILNAGEEEAKPFHYYRLYRRGEP